jgi:hypothetical protein
MSCYQIDKIIDFYVVVEIYVKFNVKNIPDSGSDNMSTTVIHVLEYVRKCFSLRL